MALKTTMEEDFSNNDNNFIEERINANNNGNLNNNNVNNENQINIYYPNDFKKEVIINILINNNIIHNNLNCPIYGKIMKLTTNNNYIDLKVWRYSTSNFKHDIKLNIKKHSIFDG